MRDDAAAAESRRLVCAVTVGYRGGGRHLARAVRTGPGQFFPLRTPHCGATLKDLFRNADNSGNLGTRAQTSCDCCAHYAAYGFRTDTS